MEYSHHSTSLSPCTYTKTVAHIRISNYVHIRMRIHALSNGVAY